MLLEASRHIWPLCANKFPKKKKNVADVVYIAGTAISISAEALHAQVPFHVNILLETPKYCEGERMMSFKRTRQQALSKKGYRARRIVMIVFKRMLWWEFRHWDELLLSREANQNMSSESCAFGHYGSGVSVAKSTDLIRSNRSQCWESVECNVCLNVATQLSVPAVQLCGEWG